MRVELSIEKAGIDSGDEDSAMAMCRIKGMGSGDADAAKAMCSIKGTGNGYEDAAAATSTSSIEVTDSGDDDAAIFSTKLRIVVMKMLLWLRLATKGWVVLMRYV